MLVRSEPQDAESPANRVRVPLTYAIAFGAIAWAVAFAPACTRAKKPDADVRVQCTVRPDPPSVGSATVDIAIADPAGLPVKGARVRVEGNMNHAGMVPSIAQAKETEPGHYRADLELTMGGDWVLLVEAGLADGRKVERTFPLPSVRGR